MRKSLICFQHNDNNESINKNNYLHSFLFIMRSIVCSLRQFVIEQLGIEPLSFGILLLLFISITVFLGLYIKVFCCKIKKNEDILKKKWQCFLHNLSSTSIMNSISQKQNHINTEINQEQSNPKTSKNNRRRFLSLMLTNLDEFESLTPLINTPLTEKTENREIQTEKSTQKTENQLPKKSITSLVLALGNKNQNVSSTKTNLNSIINHKNKLSTIDILNSPSMKYIADYLESTPSPPPPRRFPLGGKTVIVPLTNINSSRFVRKALFMEAATKSCNQYNNKIVTKPIISSSTNCCTITEADEEPISVKKNENSIGIDRTLSSQLFISSDDEDYLISLSDEQKNENSNFTCFENAMNIYSDLMSIDRV